MTSSRICAYCKAYRLHRLQMALGGFCWDQIDPFWKMEIKRVCSDLSGIVASLVLEMVGVKELGSGVVD